MSLPVSGPELDRLAALGTYGIIGASMAAMSLALSGALTGLRNRISLYQALAMPLRARLW